MNRYRFRQIRQKSSYFLLSCFLVSMIVLLGGCANKAKVVRVGASQFEVESLAAIEKIDELRRKEIETTPLPQKEASQFFVNAVKKSTGPITLQTLRTLLEPLKVEAPKSEEQWQAFLQKMRQQYTSFAATFASLETGSLLAGSSLKGTIPVLDKLIAQMTAFASSIKGHPAEFLRERAAIAADMERVRDAQPFTETTDLKLMDLERRLREIADAEKQITRDTMEQALKAATLGIQLRQLLQNYSKLSVDDVAEGLAVAFKLAADIPGLDLSGLKAKTDDFIQKINEDEILKQFFDTALSEIGKARTTPG